MIPNLPEVGPDTPDVDASKLAGLRQLLPKLAQPWWYRLVGTDYRDEQRDALAALSPEGQKIAARKARKADRRQARLHAARQAELATLFPVKAA